MVTAVTDIEKIDSINNIVWEAIDDMVKQQELKILEMVLSSQPSTEFKTTWERLLSNWTYLSSAFVNNDPSLETLALLLRMELDGRRRKFMVDRLLQRISMKLRKQLLEDFQKYLEDQCVSLL